MQPLLISETHPYGKLDPCVYVMQNKKNSMLCKIKTFLCIVAITSYKLSEWLFLQIGFYESLYYWLFTLETSFYEI